MIRVSNLEKAYGDVRAVDGVSFEIERGEVVGFLGPNGAGKSTTMRMITGFLEPDGGTVEVAGHSLAREPLAARRAVGYLPETTPLYRSMRVDEYLDWAARARGLGSSERRAAIDSVRERCDLVGWGRRRIGELSKGYRQRVGLAQALVGDPPVLVLDEPTSGLDPTEIVRIRALVAALGKERTVMVSSHVLGEVQEVAQRVLILAGGRVVADGRPHELAAGESARVVLVVEGDGSADELTAVLGGAAGVAGVRRLAEPSAGRFGARHSFALETTDSERSAAEVARGLAATNWRLLELRPERPTLEDVFLRRTAPQEREPRGTTE